MDINFSFRTPEQREFFNVKVRNSCFSGGFGNGKSYVGCQKAVLLLSTFPNYRMIIARYEESKLRETTMKTFFKPDVCPPELYDPKLGGNRTDSMNRLKLVNGSEVLWMNLKDTDEGFVRGVEVNSVLVDQAEEISENMATLLSARVGRWDQAKVPQQLLDKYPDWPIAPNTRRPRVPSYFMLLCNPDSELHWIYRRYHPDSIDWQKRFHKNHVMVQGASTTATLDPELLEEMMQNDPAWVDRFVKGKWGIPGGQIHQITDASILKANPDFTRNVIERGNLFRILDHGDTAPTCCLWFSAYKGWYFCYREYYKPEALISDHRANIAALSGNEQYSMSLADPAIFKKSMQKYGGAWTVADEYLDKNIDAPQIYWQPADNNELATRNRVSELLRPTAGISHPITGEKPAPRIYFLQRSEEYPSGPYFAVSQLRSQKRKKIGTIDGKDYFSDDRDDNIEDHAYDCIRYFCASHGNSPSAKKPKAPPNSFFAMRRMIQMRNRGVSVLGHL